jgi:hypothetical protein
MTQQSSNFGLLMLVFGAIFGFAGYPLFLMQRKRIGFLFGLFAGLWITVNFKEKFSSQASLIAMGVSGVVGAVLFYSSLQLMNIGVSLMLGLALSHQIYAIVIHQLPSPILPIIVGIICAVLSMVAGIPFMIGILALTGALMMVAGLEALLLRPLMFDSNVTVIGFNLSPAQNALFILILIALTAAGCVSQFYALRSLLQRR